MGLSCLWFLLVALFFYFQFYWGIIVSPEKRCTSSFIWDKNEDDSLGRQPVRPLRNCSSEVGGRVRVYVSLVKRNVQWNTRFGGRWLLIRRSRCLLVMLVLFQAWGGTRIALRIFSCKGLTIWRHVLPVFPRAQRASFLISALNFFQGVKGQQLQWPVTSSL